MCYRWSGTFQHGSYLFGSCGWKFSRRWSKRLSLETKYFNSIQGWRIESLQPAAVQGSVPPPPVPPADAFEPATNFSKEQEDDLPF